MDSTATQVFINPHHGTPGVVVLNATGFRRARAELASWDGYTPTPLHDLPDAARDAAVGSVHLKDEAGRFGLGSFKALGGAYAVLCVIQAELARRGVAAHPTAADLVARRFPEAGAMTVCCATDGNHGRSVAWGARQFGARCVIYVHKTVSASRVAAIAAFGADVRRVPGTYDDAVRTAAADATREAWTVVSDTSYPGYTEIPRRIMQGYRVMVAEALEAMPAPPTHVFIQGGVGGVAAAVSVQARGAAVVVVEPDRAACLLASAAAGRPVAIGGALDTIMAGLACGEPSLLAWQELDRGAAAFMAIPDPAAVAAMRWLAARGIVSGESGAAGLAGFLAAAGQGAGRAALGLCADSRVLLFSTEGATDPALYAELTA